jgi:hypothetical protein
MKSIRYLSLFGLLALLLGPATAGAAQLSGSEVRALLAGNSIVHPDFGCVFYLPDGSMHVVSLAGDVTTGKWAVRGDLYFSSGRCGVTGCIISGEYPSFTFRRADDGYEQPVILIRGNYCEKDGVVS